MKHTYYLAARSEVEAMNNIHGFELHTTLEGCQKQIADDLLGGCSVFEVSFEVRKL